MLPVIIVVIIIYAFLSRYSVVTSDWIVYPCLTGYVSRQLSASLIWGQHTGDKWWRSLPQLLQKRRLVTLKLTRCTSLKRWVFVCVRSFKRWTKKMASNSDGYCYNKLGRFICVMLEMWQPSHWVCKPAYLVPVPSQDKVGGLVEEGHPA